MTLKAIYELLDEGPQPFDGIVWTTAKANVLTPTDIREIDGAIKDSLGILRAAAGVLDATSTDEPLDVLQKWLSEFRILLIIDNLETILDERLRRFASEIPSGSKLLFTTHGEKRLSVASPLLQTR